MTDRSQPTRGSAGQEEVRVGWRMGALGMQTAAEVAAGALLGWLVDRWAGTTQGVAIGAAAGVLVGLWSLVRGSMKMMKELDRAHPPRVTTQARKASDRGGDEHDDGWSKDDWNGEHDDERDKPIDRP